MLAKIENNRDDGMEVKRYTISEIRANQEVHCRLVVREKELRTARNGRAYLTLKLADKTGQIIGRVWEKAEDVFSMLCSRDVVAIRARSETYRDQIQLNIMDVSVIPREEVDPRDFIPECSVSVARLWDQLREITANIKRLPLKSLLKRIYADTDLMNRFKEAPAAKSVHHAYLGGLLEHSISVAQLVSMICDHYDDLDLDRDLLVTAAIVHDIGKVDEYIYELGIDYSDPGRLIGHVVLGWQILDDKIKSLKNFPERDALLLKHLVLSHHGESEFGAVRVPMTREAFVLHFADDLDARMNSVSRILEDKGASGELWTAYQPLYQRYFFRGWPEDDESTACSNPERTEGKSPKGEQLVLWKVASAESSENEK